VILLLAAACFTIVMFTNYLGRPAATPARLAALPIMACLLWAASGQLWLKTLRHADRRSNSPSVAQGQKGNPSAVARLLAYSIGVLMWLISLWVGTLTMLFLVLWSRGAYGT
jgi:hypothetical protein